MRGRNVFISHAHTDNGITDDYARALGRRGIDVWYDRNDLSGGETISHEIEQQLQARSNFIILVTEESASSYWVRLETDAYRALAAEDPSRLILPVKIRPSRMPALLGGIAWIDATAMPFEESVDRIEKAIYQDEPQRAAELHPEFTSPVRSATREPVQDVVGAFPVTVSIITLVAFVAVGLAVYGLVGRVPHTVNIGTLSFNIGTLSFATALQIFIVGVLVGWMYGILHYVVTASLMGVMAVVSRVPPTEFAYRMEIRMMAPAKGEIVRRLIQRGVAIQNNNLPAHVPVRKVSLLYSREDMLAQGESFDRCGVKAIITLRRSRLPLKGVVTRAVRAVLTVMWPKLGRSTVPFKGVFTHAVYAQLEYGIMIKQTELESIYTMDYAQVTLQSLEELDTESLARAQEIIKRYFVNPYLAQPLSLD